MLILTRKVGQKIRIGDDIEIVLVDVKGPQARIGIKAPKGVPVHREEVYERIQEENLKAAANAPGARDLDDLPF